MTDRSLASVSERVFNFSPGPAVLPLEVLERARDELLALPGVGISILEISHRALLYKLKEYGLSGEGIERK